MPDAGPDREDVAADREDAAVDQQDAAADRDASDGDRADPVADRADAVGDLADAPGTDAGVDATAAYNPCPGNGAACRIMPLGDSITDGCCGENVASMGGSYRLELFRLSLAQHKNVTFVGSHASGPGTVDGVVFPKQQEGHPGWTIADGGGREGLQQQIVGWLASTPPDIVTLMIGTNDVDIQLDLVNAPKRLAKLLDTIIAAAPKALIVVAQMVPTRNDDENARVRAYNAAMPGIVDGLAAAGRHVRLVDMYAAFTKDPAYKTKDLWDNLHPTDAGYGVMARVWWDAIGTLPSERR